MLYRPGGVFFSLVLMLVIIFRLPSMVAPTKSFCDHPSTIWVIGTAGSHFYLFTEDLSGWQLSIEDVQNCSTASRTSLGCRWNLKTAPAVSKSLSPTTNFDVKSTMGVISETWTSSQTVILAISRKDLTISAVAKLNDLEAKFQKISEIMKFSRNSETSSSPEVLMYLSIDKPGSILALLTDRQLVKLQFSEESWSLDWNTQKSIGQLDVTGRITSGFAYQNILYLLVDRQVKVYQLDDGKQLRAEPRERFFGCGDGETRFRVGLKKLGEVIIIICVSSVIILLGLMLLNNRRRKRSKDLKLGLTASVDPSTLPGASRALFSKSDIDEPSTAGPKGGPKFKVKSGAPAPKSKPRDEAEAEEEEESISDEGPKLFGLRHTPRQNSLSLFRKDERLAADQKLRGAKRRRTDRKKSAKKSRRKIKSATGKK